MIRSARPPPARRSARIWPRNRPGRSSPSRIARQPSAGIFLDHGLHIGQRLVAADVEGAEGHRLRAGGIQHRAVQRELVAGARQALADHELQFGAEQADAGAAGVVDMRQVDGEPGIDHQFDRLAVLGDAGHVAQRRILRLAAGAEPDPLGIGRFDLRRRADIDRARGAVDDDGIAGIGDAGRVRHFADRGDAERARHDRDVGIGGAFLQHQPAQPLAVVVEQRRRSHRARDQDGVVGQMLARGRVILPDQLPHQPVAEILQVVQAVAQIGIGGAQHAGAGVGLHALDGGLRGQAGGDRLVQLVRPALVVGEHPVGFQHVAVLAALGDVAALQHAVEIGAQLGQRGVQPLDFLRQVLGDVVVDDDARLVQHDMAERDAVGQDRAGLVQRMPRRGLGAGLRQRGQFARGDHLRQHHRGGLQRLDLFLDIGALGAVLHHQHAERIAGAQDRHAEEGVVDFLAGLRAEREGGVALRVVQVERRRLAGDEADQALMGAQHGAMHGVAVEAFGGVELQRVVDAQHIDRADLGHHVGGDQHHDLVQSLLGRDLLRHGFAEPSQQDAGASRRAPHVLISLREASPTGRREPAVNSSKTTILYIRRRREPCNTGRIRITKTVAQFAAAHPAGRIANWGLFCQAKRLPAA